MPLSLVFPLFFPDLPDKINLYRYISFEKFYSLIEKSSLYFCKAKFFTDNWEGAYPYHDLRYVIKESYQIEKLIKRENPNSSVNIDEIVLNKMKGMEMAFEESRNNTFLNCWVKDYHESIAMWKLYVQEANGVVIKSSYNNLKNVLEKNSDYDLYMSNVFYIDYEKDYFYKNIKEHFKIDKEREAHLGHLNLFAPFVHKRKHFEYEKEYRLILGILDRQEIKKYDSGIFVNIDLNLLVEEIILSPNCSKEFEEMVNSVLSKFGIKKLVTRSKLDIKPYSATEIMKGYSSDDFAPLI